MFTALPCSFLCTIVVNIYHWPYLVPIFVGLAWPDLCCCCHCLIHLFIFGLALSALSFFFFPNPLLHYWSFLKWFFLFSLPCLFSFCWYLLAPFAIVGLAWSALSPFILPCTIFHRWPCLFPFILICLATPPVLLLVFTRLVFHSWLDLNIRCYLWPLLIKKWGVGLYLKNKYPHPPIENTWEALKNYWLKQKAPEHPCHSLNVLTLFRVQIFNINQLCVGAALWVAVRLLLC